MAKNPSFAKIPRAHFGVIYADPPWHFRTWSAKGRDRCPDNKHYPTLTTDMIASLDVRSIAKRDCVLFMWATWPMLRDALFVIDAWGFKYKTCAFTWMKTIPNEFGQPPNRLAVGTGYWTRANTEICLLATRGSPKRKHRDVEQAILSERREHSRKPDCVYDRIERLVSGPYLELFARTQRAGWTSWGNERRKFK